MFQENGDFTSADGLQRGVQYPFSVNEKVIIKVNMICFTFNFFGDYCIRWSREL
jgi:hypothetical protein